ncbi:DEAD/DEAH box helicase [Crassaminicella profunda]|nr:DEAD/DEAH box helicase [Crassaminicella profunda]QZY57293.1 DEAD/DEAH box helicase [Crassaminicella profunda]
MKNNFLNIGIGDELKDRLDENGIVEPTPIQIQAIPPLLAGKDVIGKAQTGTGKTLAFLLPMMEKIDVNKPHVQGLIIAPTRELAIQITAEAKKLLSAKGIKILAAYGGQDVVQQIRKLKGNIHMVIGTPGRLLDHIRRESVDFGKLSMLVLDEADQMLHMGFLKEVEMIIRHTPKRRQTMCFSATMPKQINSLAAKYMKEPVAISVKSNNVTLDEITQLVIQTTDRGKREALYKVLDDQKPFMAVIFCRTKRRASALNEELQKNGYNSDELHGDLTQAKREKVMKSFRRLQVQFLVATDVAARGLDIEGMTHVFNYDIPQDAESYIHRIGRTGRAGKNGVAITFVTQKDRETLNQIEKGIKMTMKKINMVKEEDRGSSEWREKGNRGYNKFKKFGKEKDQRSGRKKSSKDQRSSNNKKNEGSKKGKGKFAGTKKQDTTKGNSRGRSEKSNSKRYSKGKKS